MADGYRENGSCAADRHDGGPRRDPAQAPASGCVEIDQAVLPADQPQSGQAPPAETDSLSLLREQLSRPDTQRLGTAREEQNQADHALYVLKKYAPAKEKFLVPKPSLDETDLFDQAAADRARQSAQEINGAFRRVNTIHAEQTKLAAQKAQLEPWRTMDLPLDTQSTAQVTVQMGTLPRRPTSNAAQGRPWLPVNCQS